MLLEATKMVIKLKQKRKREVGHVQTLQASFLTLRLQDLYEHLTNGILHRAFQFESLINIQHEAQVRLTL